MNLSVHIFLLLDFQCQCIQWLLFVRFCESPLSTSVDTILAPLWVLSLNSEIAPRAIFSLFFRRMIWNHHNKYCDLFFSLSVSNSIYFSSTSSVHLSLSSMSLLNYLSSPFSRCFSNSICIFVSSIQHYFCCYIFIRLEWHGYESRSNVRRFGFICIELPLLGSFSLM